MPPFDTLTHESIGDYSYFVEPNSEKYSKYDVYMRIHNENLEKFQDENQRKEVNEVVLDIAEVPFIREKWRTTTV